MSDVFAEADCGPLAWALNIFGDRWSLMAVSEIARGTSRFNDIQQRTGMPRSRLATGLRRLERWAIVSRTPYCDRPPRAGCHRVRRRLVRALARQATRSPRMHRVPAAVANSPILALDDT